MTILAFIIGSLLAATLGALYHLIRGGSGVRLIVYLLASGTSFWFGHLVATILGIHFLSIGPIRAGLAVPFVLIALVVTEWLGAVDSGEGA